MKKLLFLFTFLVAVQTSASHYDVIYRFENAAASSDEYFVVKLDFDYVAPDDWDLGNQQQVFSYEEFVELYQSFSDFRPIFFFEIALVESNMSFELMGTSIGATRIFATNQPMITSLPLGEFGVFTYYEPLDSLYFPTGWELGQNFYTSVTFGGDNFVLTEITPVPLPAALPLFGFALLLLARSKCD